MLNVTLGEILGRSLDMARLQDYAPEVEHELLVGRERRIGARQQLLRSRMSFDGQLREAAVSRSRAAARSNVVRMASTGKINWVK